MDKQVMKKIKIVILRKRIGTENKSNWLKRFIYFLDMDKQVMKKIKIVILRKRKRKKGKKSNKSHFIYFLNGAKKKIKIDWYGK
jgi:hypothetical protein